MRAGAGWRGYRAKAAAVNEPARPPPSTAGKQQLLTGGSRRVELEPRKSTINPPSARTGVK